MSDNLFTKYVSATGQKCNCLKIQVYYDLGGYNYFTYQPTTRGYYLAVTPVERTERNGYTTESTTMFAGIKKLILPVKRRSVKNDAFALNLYKNDLSNLIDYVVKESDIEVQEEL